MAVTTINGQRQAAKPSLLYRPEFRQALYQIILMVGLIFFAWEIISNVADNLRRQNIASGFGFWDRTAGFDISQTLIPYSNVSTYGQAFWVGLLNTLLVAALGITFATILGFVIGIARLSTNWLVAKLATAYVEVIRNVPLLLQLLFWYFAVLKHLPSPRQSLAVPGGGFLNVRGLYLPYPVAQPGFGAVLISLAIGIVGSIAVYLWARRRQLATGQRFPVLWTTLALIIGLPLVVYLLSGMPLGFEYPELKGFNFQGGIVVQPEFMALLLGLSIYTASFIAEIVRAGILGVSKGQKEAARAIGLTNGQMLRLVVIPQAMRIIIPPLTSQYLNLTKNSSLAVAIGYPDFVSVFTGTVLNQTGQAVEVILLTMCVFLTLSLLTSALMNWFNARMALVER
ncbi:MAG: amino acid ABC transporter permease [Bacteroidota bacterium]|jgi:general L-amino acid transport system permease protein